MPNPKIKTQIETVLDNLRDLAYETNCEWQRQGMRNDDIISLSVACSNALNDVSSAVACGSFNFGGAPMTITDVGGHKKIQAIKAVREITGAGLKEAKEMVDRTANGSASITYELGYASPDPAKIKAFTDTMLNAGYAVS